MLLYTVPSFVTLIVHTSNNRVFVAGSSAIEENKLNETPCDSAELKRDGAMKLLKGVLHLKPIVLEGLSLSSSDFPSYLVIDLKPLQGGSLKKRKMVGEWNED